MDGSVTFVVPVAVLTVLLNLAIAFVSRAKTKQAIAEGDGNVMMNILKGLAEGQKDNRECLIELKSSEARQTEILSDIRDILKETRATF